MKCVFNHSSHTLLPVRAQSPTKYPAISCRLTNFCDGPTFLFMLLTLMVNLQQFTYIGYPAI